MSYISILEVVLLIYSFNIEEGEDYLSFYNFTPLVLVSFQPQNLRNNHKHIHLECGRYADSVFKMYLTIVLLLLLDNTS